MLSPLPNSGSGNNFTAKYKRDNLITIRVMNLNEIEMVVEG